MADMPWKQAIATVLRDAKEAMHYSDIADEIAGRGLRENLGATPHNTVGSVLSMNPELFIRTARGEYMLGSPGVEAVDAEDQELVDDSSGEATDDSRTIVRAFGMFWRRDHVFWKSVPKLLGQQTLNSTSVDFSPQLGVYLLHDGRHTVYVGRSVDRPLGQRLFEHTRDRLNGRWDRFSWFGLKAVRDDGSQELVEFTPSSDDWVSTMEALLIEALEPPQNRKRGDDFKAVEYLQVKDPELKRRSNQLLLAELQAKLGEDS